MTEKLKQDSYLTVCFNNNRNTENFKITGKEEFLIFHYMLGKHAVLSERNRVEEYLQGKEKFFSTKNILLNTRNLLQCLKKINLSTLSNELDLPIDKELVHKTLQENVMVSEINLPLDVKIGLFSGDVTHTCEIKLDHLNSEHTEAVFLTELCRQASMVSLSKFLGSDSEYYIIEEFKKFKHFVQRDKEIFVHTLPVTSRKAKGRGLCLYTIYQDNNLCMSGYYQIVYTKKGDKNV